MLSHVRSFSALMFICLQKPEILSLRANEILTAVIHGARKEEPSADVQLAAIHALYNSLEFMRENFDRDVRFFRLSWFLGFFFFVFVFVFFFGCLLSTI